MDRSGRSTGPCGLDVTCGDVDALSTGARKRPEGLSRNDRSNRSTIREPLACPRVTSVCTCFMCRIRADVAGAPERTMAHVPGSR